MCRAHSHRARRERAEAPRRTGTSLAFAPPAKGEVLPANYCLREMPRLLRQLAAVDWWPRALPLSLSLPPRLCPCSSPARSCRRAVSPLVRLAVVQQVLTLTLTLTLTQTLTRTRTLTLTSGAVLLGEGVEEGLDERAVRGGLPVDVQHA